MILVILKSGILRKSEEICLDLLPKVILSGILLLLILSIILKWNLSGIWLGIFLWTCQESLFVLGLLVNFALVTFSLRITFTCIYACQESLLEFVYARELCIENIFFCLQSSSLESSLQSSFLQRILSVESWNKSWNLLLPKVKLICLVLNQFYILSTCERSWSLEVLSRIFQRGEICSWSCLKRNTCEICLEIETENS